MEDKTCRTCEHWKQDQFIETYGVCAQLSNYPWIVIAPEKEKPGMHSDHSATAYVWKSRKNWGCVRHQESRAQQQLRELTEKARVQAGD